MWIKICANTNLEDARLAAELGADAVGFVFAESTRKVTASQVAEIVPELPVALEKIGVFTTRDADEIAGIVRQAGLTGAQLHGGLDLGLARRLKAELGAEVQIIQTLHWVVGLEDAGRANNADEVLAQVRSIAEESAVDRVLVDSKTVAARGGSGVAFDWSAARAVLAGVTKRLIVAGGLRPENVAGAIEALDPWGVDVASGVEAVPGRKDAVRLQRFIENARENKRT